MVGFGILPHGYPLLGSFSACHLSPVCFRVFLTAEILTAKYFVEVVGRFSAVANCSLFRLLVKLPYGNGCQLKVCAAVHETTSAQNFPSSSGPGDASGILFSTIKGYLWVFHSHQQNTWYKLNPVFVISVIAAAWVLCWISSFLLLPARLSLWNANTITD